jgi:hypothetical protein
MLLFALLTALSLSTGPLVALPRQDLVLTTWGLTLPARILAAIASEARSIWAPYLDLRVTVASAAVPAGPLTAIISEVPIVARQTDSVGLGELMFSGPSTPANRILLSTAGIRLLAEDAVRLGMGRAARSNTPDSFLVHALARTLAHEVGHFVLRSQQHSRSGLMRARFSTAELIDGDLSHYRLTPDDTRRLTATFAQRPPQAE